METNSEATVCFIDNRDEIQVIFLQLSSLRSNVTPKLGEANNLPVQVLSSLPKKSLPFQHLSVRKASPLYRLRSEGKTDAVICPESQAGYGTTRRQHLRAWRILSNSASCRCHLVRTSSQSLSCRPWTTNRSCPCRCSCVQQYSCVHAVAISSERRNIMVSEFNEYHRNYWSFTSLGLLPCPHIGLKLAKKLTNTGEMSNRCRKIL